MVDGTQFPRCLLVPALVLVPVLLTSCVVTSVTPLSSNVRPATEPEDVRIYVDERDIPGPHEKLGLIHARGDTGFTNQNTMLQKARRDAADLGANGLLLRSIEEASQGAKVAAAFLGTSTQRHGEMVAIFVFPTEPDAKPPVEGGEASEAVQDTSAEPGTGPTFEEWLAEQDEEDG